MKEQQLANNKPIHESLNLYENIHSDTLNR